MSTLYRVVAGLAVIALVGCSESITEPDRAFEVEFSASAVDVALDPCAGVFNLTTQAEVDAFSCTNVDGRLNIGPSTDIANVTALSGLVSVGGPLVLHDMPALTNLDGLSSLASVGDLVFLGDTPLLNVDGLSSLVSISGVLIVYGDGLTDLDGLSSLESVREIDFSGSSLTRVELPALESAFTLWVRQNGDLEELSLPRLPYFNYLFLENNDALTDLNFPSLVEIGFLEAINNDALPSLDGLEPLATAVWIRLDNNAALGNVDALSSLSSVDYRLDITNNPALAMCACGLYALLATGISGEIQIENNAPGCNSPSEITAEACFECASTTLLSDLESLVASGALNARQGRWLMTQLGVAVRQANKGHVPQALRKLDAFIARVIGLEADGDISSGTADALLEGVQTVRDALEAQVA